jgi:coenzyme F420-reducing hydrogenase alpha subunit
MVENEKQTAGGMTQEQTEQEVNEVLSDITEAKDLGNRILDINKRLMRSMRIMKKRETRRKLLEHRLELRTERRRKKNKVARQTRRVNRSRG